MDLTDILDDASTFTSNAANVLFGLIEAAADGADLVIENLRPLAEQLDAAFGDESNPLPATEGGVPTSQPVADTPADAAAAVGVVADTSSSTGGDSAGGDPATA